MKGKTIGLGRISLEKARFRLPLVHHVQKCRVGQKLNVIVWRRGSRGHESIDARALKVAHHLAEDFGASTMPKTRRLIERYDREELRIQFPVPHRLVVGEVKAGRSALFYPPHECDFQADHAGVMDKFLPNAKRTDYKRTAKRE